MKALEIMGPLAAVAFLAVFSWRWARLGLGHGGHCGSALVICARCEENARARRLAVPASEGSRLILFDALDVKTRCWLDVQPFRDFAASIGLPVAPELYRGPWRTDLAALAEGPSTMPGANHVREGIVVKPMRERVDPVLGRVFLKLHGEGYLTRKGG